MGETDIAILAGFKMDSFTQINTTVPDKSTTTMSGNSRKASLNTAKYTNQELKELVRAIGLDCGISTDNIQINNLYIEEGQHPAHNTPKRNKTERKIVSLL